MNSCTCGFTYIVPWVATEYRVCNWNPSVEWVSPRISIVPSLRLKHFIWICWVSGADASEQNPQIFLHSSWVWQPSVFYMEYCPQHWTSSWPLGGHIPASDKPKMARLSCFSVIALIYVLLPSNGDIIQYRFLIHGYWYRTQWTFAAACFSATTKPYCKEKGNHFGKVL